MSHRAASWLAWSLWVLSLMSIAGDGALQILNSATPTANPRSPLVLNVGFALVFLSFATVGALVASRQPGNPIGWIFCALGFTPFAAASEEYALYALVTRPDSLPGGEVMAWLAAWFGGPIIFAMLAYILLLFPDGRLLSRRWRPVVWFNLLAILLLFAGNVQPGTMENLDLLKVANPFGVAGANALLDKLSTIGIILVLAATIAGTNSLVLRWRRSRGDERQQIKWFVFAGAIFCAVFAVTPVLWSLPPSPETNWIWPTLFLMGLSTIPIAVGFAVLKYRLYDIDLIINRALVYGPLTVLLAATYAGGVLGLQSVLRGLTGQESTLAVVASTLAIAVLFNPLRQRVQAFVDRRFYRRKYDAAKTLEAFSAKLREETDLDALSNDLVGVARGTMQPAHVSLWLRPDAELEARSAALRQFGHDE